MARYFFHTADGSRDRDTEGTELPDHGAARRAAIRYIGDVMSDQPDILCDARDFRVEVTDDQGALLFTVIALAVNFPATAERG